MKIPIECKGESSACEVKEISKKQTNRKTRRLYRCGNLQSLSADKIVRLDGDASKEFPNDDPLLDVAKCANGLMANTANIKTHNANRECGVMPRTEDIVSSRPLNGDGGIEQSEYGGDDDGLDSSLRGGVIGASSDMADIAGDAWEW